IDLELVLADLETLTRRIDRTKTAMKGGDKKYLAELEVQQKLYSALEEGKPARSVKLNKEEQAIADDLFLLTTKKVIYCANVGEGDDHDNDMVKAVKSHAEAEGSEVIVLCAQVESELAVLPPDEKEIFMEELGVTCSGLEQLIKSSYRLLGLMSFLTAGEKETRAWTIKIGSKAPQAAGKIHSDFERGFIRAEIVDYETLIECGSFNVAKERGKVRSEGKDYVMQEGDVVLFRFNV
ncbi:MAG: redox-regulated ATPase YchF, partial [Clostridia bacterium]|nr:redox-regulated ATPase YchF [Clostridia bacterium]